MKLGRKKGHPAGVSRNARPRAASAEAADEEVVKVGSNAGEQHEDV